MVQVDFNVIVGIDQRVLEAKLRDKVPNQPVIPAPAGTQQPVHFAMGRATIQPFKSAETGYQPCPP